MRPDEAFHFKRRIGKCRMESPHVVRRDISRTIMLTIGREKFIAGNPEDRRAKRRVNAHQPDNCKF